jgi:hypothetical protein
MLSGFPVADFVMNTIEADWSSLIVNNLIVVFDLELLIL